MNIDKHSDNRVIETLIIGFGFSAIPLIRELENNKQEYAVISSGKSIWERLFEQEKLDFDLVSSKLTSYYSFELVNLDPADEYPTAKEFLEFQNKYKTAYQHKVIEDWVTKVHNYDDYSLVYTRSGTVYEVKHLVIATAFRRQMNSTLTEIDYDTIDENKTIVFKGYGDSANLIASKLVPKGCKIIVLTNGFLCLDKLCFYDGHSYTLDQLEMHNFRYLSKFIYQLLVGGAGVANIASTLLPKKLASALFGDSLHVKYPLADRFPSIMQTFEQVTKSPVPNGLIIIKYWPIDSYQQVFDDSNLEQSIKEGYLINDIGFFLESGLVELWKKDEVEIDKDQKTIEWQGQSISYDLLLESGPEAPHLPSIYFHRAGSEPEQFQYNVRDCYMGLIPKELSNLYLLGYVRPSTGGLCNIIEMQCLLAHKMITDKQFNQTTRANIESLLAEYEKQYYTTNKRGPQDHLVYYGYYTEDVAKFIGISPSVRDCKSIKEVMQYYFTPNNAFKFRQSGPYKVEGAKEMMETIWEQHQGFRLLRRYVANYLLLQAAALLALSFSGLPVYIILPLCIMQLLNPLMGLIVANGVNLHKYQNVILAGSLVLSVFYPHWLIPLGGFSLSLVSTFIGRKLGKSRVLFNDLKNKKRYKSFFKRYCETFNNVIKGKEQTDKAA